MPSFSQSDSGKAWEYGLAIQCATILNRNIGFVGNNPRVRSKEAYDRLLFSEQVRINNAAKEAVTFLWANDSRLSKADSVLMQGDMQGRHGDPRDILIETPSSTIGISAKHRHDALKHPRLSETIDFGRKWYDIPCSNLYWKTVRPIFSELRTRSGKWSDLPNKEAAYYLPVLTAFIREINSYADPKRLMRYLLGRFDFYKVIKDNGSIVMQSFNITGTLSWGKTLPLPSEIVNFAMHSDSNTTAMLHMDNGWQISFRIHNARGSIEPSLKFDVRLVGSPEVLVRHEIPVL